MGLRIGGIRDKVDIQQVVANNDKTVVFGIERNDTFPGGHKHTSVNVEEAIARDLKSSTEELSRLEQASVQQMTGQARRGQSLG